MILSKARAGSGAQYPRVWMKSAIVERELGNTQEVGTDFPARAQVLGSTQEVS